MEVPLRKRRNDPQPLFRALSAFQTHHLVEAPVPEVEEAEEKTWLWIVLAVLFVLWVLKTM